MAFFARRRGSPSRFTKRVCEGGDKLAGILADIAGIAPTDADAEGTR
jgi:hypothetical protein